MSKKEFEFSPQWGQVVVPRFTSVIIPLGGKSDPTKLRIGSLSDCVNDPLASKIKWKLKKFGVSPDDVMTVFSAEKPVKELLPLSDEQHANPEKYGAVENMRLRVIPVLGTSPAIFGQSMASYVLTQLGECPYDPETADRLSKNVRNRMRQVLGNNEVCVNCFLMLISF